MKRNKSKSFPIDSIRKKFHKEWLLIATDKVDETTTTVLTGRLLAHSPDVMDVHKAARRIRCRHTLLVYSEDWPKDLAAAFHAHLSHKP